MLRIAILLSAAVLAGAALAGALVVASVGDELGPLDGSKEVRLGENTRIYDRTGHLMGRIAGVTNRTEVPSGKIPQHLKDATVAIEDKRFYEHDGVDYYRLIGAAVRDVVENGPRQGGSTITMQLVKNLYFPRAERTIEQKIKEAIRARQIEERYSKDEILTKYLNGVFYGNNAIGVQAAALTYFNRPVWKITLPQAALLAGLPQAPTAYNPFENPEAARRRRNVVLQEMADQGYITPQKAEQAKRAGLGLQRGTAYEVRKEGYFFDYVRSVLIDEIGEKRVQLGGFRVETTLDPVLQRRAEEAIAGVLDFPDAPAAAVVMIDARTGYIRVMATSRKYGKDSLFNYATQATRQPGSTFKVFVLTRAIQEGINPYTTLYVSRPLRFVDPRYGPINVSTYSNTYRGAIPIASATLSSDNSVYTQLTLDLTPEKVVETAYAMGIPRERDLDPYPSVGLGGLTTGVTPLDMAIAYAPLANGGLRVEPIAIRRILGRGAGRYQDLARPKRTRVLSDGEAYEVTRILRQNVLGGTGTRANIGVPVAGKTGTTDDFVDAWFVGYTPEFVTAVWVGYPNDRGVKRYMSSVPGWGAVAGGTIPAQIWHDFMVHVAQQRGYKDFRQPSEPVSWSPFTSEYTRYAQTYAETTDETTESTASTEREGTTTRDRRLVPTRARPRSVPRPEPPGPAPTTVVPPPATQAPPAPVPPPAPPAPTLPPAAPPPGAPPATPPAPTP